MSAEKLDALGQQEQDKEKEKSSMVPSTDPQGEVTGSTSPNSTLDGTRRVLVLALSCIK